jgi:hypothetical protein
MRQGQLHTPIDIFPSPTISCPGADRGGLGPCGLAKVVGLGRDNEANDETEQTQHGAENLDNKNPDEPVANC